MTRPSAITPVSCGLTTPSPPAEKPTARQDQARPSFCRPSCSIILIQTEALPKMQMLEHVHEILRTHVLVEDVGLDRVMAVRVGCGHAASRGRPWDPPAPRPCHTL